MKMQMPRELEGGSAPALRRRGQSLQQAQESGVVPPPSPAQFIPPVQPDYPRDAFFNRFWRGPFRRSARRPRHRTC